MSKRTISINPQFFNISKKKKKIIPSEVNINASNIRQLLLDKLKEHKKTRKIETTPTPLLQDKTFDESCNEKEPERLERTMTSEIISEIRSEKTEDKSESKDKPYGNLKNGSKPTYKMYQTQSIPVQSNPVQINPIQSQHQGQQGQQDYQDEEHVDPIILEEKEVKKTFKLGKSDKTKTISILIKNNKTRKKIEDKKTEHKKTHLSTIKNYLKEKNLIKFGSTAPSKLLREMFETSELCGGILNQNKDVLIHNFDK